MKKSNRLCICLLFCAGLLAGCGQAKVPEVVETSSIAVTKEGEVTSYLVDIFDKDYYTVDGLTKMAVEEAADYNTEHGVSEEMPVIVEKVELLTDGSDKIVVIHKFNSTDTFEDYTEGILFYGTVAQAQAKGYSLSASLIDVKKDAALTKEELLGASDKHILITDRKVKLYCPQTVTHVSNGAVLGTDGSVDATAAEGTVYILMK